MKIIMLRDDDTYGELLCGQEIDTDEEGSPVNYEQAWALCARKQATDDLDSIAPRGLKHEENHRYTCKANMVINGSIYQLKDNIREASYPIDFGEWDLIIQGVV